MDAPIYPVRASMPWWPRKCAIARGGYGQAPSREESGVGSRGVLGSPALLAGDYEPYLFGRDPTGWAQGRSPISPELTGRALPCRPVWALAS